MSLYKMKKNCRCIIESLPQIPLMDSLGFRLGSAIQVQSRQPMGGPVVVKLGNRSVAVAREYAEQMTVREVL